MSRRVVLRVRACMAVALLLLVGACSHVHPYEREHLSRPNMTPADEAHEAQFQAHLRESREGASAGSSAAGGGCGCN
jgi:Domain of unknown function (DUF4266)